VEKERESMSNDTDPDERHFQDAVGKDYDAKAPDLTKTLNIVVVGKVSSGKSSLINAFLRCTRENRVAEVSAPSGTTTAVRVMQLDDHVCIIDTPGLDDIESRNSDVTTRFLKALDIGILVVTGAANVNEKAHVEKLQATCKRVFVVLNRIDEWDKHTPAALQKVIDQWRQGLGVDRIYPTCAFGFDPDTRADVPLDIRGVDDLRAAVEAFTETEGKALLLARQMRDKRSYATNIIVAALVAVAGEAFVPGSAVYITVTQAVAIMSLYYLYTGRVLSKASALAILPRFAAQSIGTTLFLWVTSFLPPTGVINVAAAVVAMTVTAAMLIAVASLLASGAELEERAKLTARYNELRGTLKTTLASASWADVKTAAFWQKIIRDLMYA
jgi:small GTP-binding protein